MMIDPKRLQKLNEAIRLAKQVRDIQKHQRLIEFLKQNKSWLSTVPPQSLEKIREAADYDQAEWGRIVREFQ